MDLEHLTTQIRELEDRLNMSTSEEIRETAKEVAKLQD